jgi:hypothetical protein
MQTSDSIEPRRSLRRQVTDPLTESKAELSRAVSYRQLAGPVPLVDGTQSQSGERARAMGGGLVDIPKCSSSSFARLNLSGSQLGVAFRRQVPLDRYIVDFLAPSLQLIVEVDGLWHHRRMAADERRESRCCRCLSNS